MSSDLTIRLEMKDDPEGVVIGVIGSDHRRVCTIARSAVLREPWSTANINRAVRMLVTSWLEPELAVSGDEAIHDVFEGLTQPF